MIKAPIEVLGVGSEFVAAALTACYGGPCSAEWAEDLIEVAGGIGTWGSSGMAPYYSGSGLPIRVHKARPDRWVGFTPEAGTWPSLRVYAPPREGAGARVWVGRGCSPGQLGCLLAAAVRWSGEAVRDSDGRTMAPELAAALHFLSQSGREHDARVVWDNFEDHREVQP